MLVATTAPTATITKEEVPFFPFRPNFPTWEGDLAYTGSDYLLLNNQTKKTEDPAKDKSQFVMWIDKVALQEIQYIVERMTTITGECAFMMMTKPLSQSDCRQVLAYDYFMAEQDATGAHVQLNLEDVQRYTDYFQTNYPEHCTNMADNLQHGHSHGTIATINSSTDIKQQESKDQLGFQSKHRFFLIFNTYKSIRATVVMYSPVFHRFEDVPVGIYTGDQIERNHVFDSERKKELNIIMDALIRKPAPTQAPVYTYTAQNNWERYPYANYNHIHDYDYADTQKPQKPWYAVAEEEEEPLDDYDYMEIGLTVRSMVEEALLEDSQVGKPYDKPLCNKLAVAVVKDLFEQNNQLVEMLEQEYQVFEEDGDFNLQYFTFHMVRLLLTGESDLSLEKQRYVKSKVLIALDQLEALASHVMDLMENPLFQGLNSYSVTEAVSLNTILFADKEVGLLEFLLP